MSSPSHLRMAFCPPAPFALALAAGILLLLGCDRDQVTRSVPAPAASPAANPAPAGMPGGMPGAVPPGMTGDVPPPPAPSNPLKWTLPKGWTSTPGSGMRFATLNPPGPGKVELSVVCLPGSAGGELANVNRWRGQIGLEPIDEKALAAAKKTVKSKAGAVTVFDFTSQGQVQSRMLTGTLTTQDGNSWFLKLVGDAEPVGKARPEFLKFLETLHLD
jgi:hypothetical protein